jgi:hypothetical protein
MGEKSPFISRILMRGAFFVAIVGAFKKIDFYKEKKYFRLQLNVLIFKTILAKIFVFEF